MSRRLSVLTMAALLPLLAACTTTGSGGPNTAPGAGAPTIAAADVPPVPAGASDEVRQAWSALRSGSGAAGATAADSSSEALALAGFGQLRNGNVGAARASFDAALEASPRLAVAAYGMGLVARAQGQRDIAAQWFARALELDPELARADLATRGLALDGMPDLLARAEGSAQAGDLAGAAAAYRVAIDAAPWVAGPYVRLARLQEQLDGPEAGIAVLEEGRRRTDDAAVIVEQLGRAYMAADRHAEASEAFDRLVDLRPDDASAQELARTARARYEEAVLPAEYRNLGSRDVVTREELAAALAINLQGLDAAVDRRSGVIIADIGDRWSAPFVQRMVESRVLDVYQNNTFWPEMEVRRSMLVEAAWRVIEAVGADETAPRVSIQDPPPEHLLYRPVQVVVGLGIMSPGRDGDFDLLELVSGAEVLETVRRLATLVRERTS